MQMHTLGLLSNIDLDPAVVGIHATSKLILKTTATKQKPALAIIQRTPASKRFSCGHIMIEKSQTLTFIFIGICFPFTCISGEGPVAAGQDYQDRVILDISVRSTEENKHGRRGLKISLAESGQDSSDADNDGLSDAVEAIIGTRPDQADSDCDGLLDHEEVLDADGDPAVFDQDNDAIADALESRRTDSDNDGRADDQDPDTLVQVVCGRFAPFAITETQSTTFSIRAITPGIARLILNPGAGGLELHDDGTHGDQRAGDGVFTRSGIGWAALSQWSTDVYEARSLGVHQVTGDYAEIQTGNGLLDLAPIVIRMPADRLVPVTEVSQDIWVSDRAVAIVDPELSARVWDGEARDAFIRFLGIFGDRFDFVQIYPNGRGSPSYAAYHSTVVNTVEGIGLSLFNNRGTLGLPAGGQILGYQWQNNSAGPGATTHEIMHQWQAFAGDELGLGQCVGAHWGILGQGRGVMGGFDPTSLIERSPGSYEVDYFSTCCAVGQLYTPLELYFAGLAPASEVPPLTVPVNANCSSLDCITTPGKCTFEAERMETVNIEQLIALEGQRNPGYGQARTHFTIAHVLITDVEPSPAELSSIEEKAWIFENPENQYSFYRISRGRGTIDALIGVNSEIPIFLDGFE